MKNKITNILKRLGVPADIKGYYYLRCAVEVVTKDFSFINQITKKLYPEIANQFETTPSRVERAIRHAVETSWNRGDREFQIELFGYTVDANKGKPTNSEFIMMLADYIREESISCDNAGSN